MTISDYAMAISLWEQSEGMALSEADSREAIELFLNRNSGMSWVCTYDGKVVGTVLCGHDGRRGYLYHLAVCKDHQGNENGRKLVEKALSSLKAEGIMKCHLMVFVDNVRGNQFWSHVGWTKREDILLYSYTV